MEAAREATGGLLVRVSSQQVPPMTLRCVARSGERSEQSTQAQTQSPNIRFPSPFFFTLLLFFFRTAVQILQCLACHIHVLQFARGPDDGSNGDPDDTWALKRSLGARNRAQMGVMVLGA